MQTAPPPPVAPIKKYTRASGKIPQEPVTINIQSDDESPPKEFGANIKLALQQLQVSPVSISLLRLMLLVGFQVNMDSPKAVRSNLEFHKSGLEFIWEQCPVELPYTDIEAFEVRFFASQKHISPSVVIASVV